MASRVEDNLKCPSCLDIFQDSVMLPCSHSFRRACVQQWWEFKEARTCPVCRTECSSMDVPSNLTLRDVCEAFSQTSVKSEESCSLHKEKLKLFCLDHQELVCLICRDAEIHAGHQFHPVDEAVKGPKEKVRESLQGVKKILKDSNKISANCNEQAVYLKVQREQVKSKIKKDFEELHRFLQVEEEARLSAVRVEEQQKSGRMKDKIEVLNRDMAALAGVIKTTEEQLTSDPIFFMKNFQTTMSRIQKLPNMPELLPGALLDEAKHVGNLKFNVWERMTEIVSYSPVILDPNTANPGLSLSEDLTSVTCQDGRDRPQNPERFDWYYVVGSALTSGTHMWEAEVGDNTDWELGVMCGDPCLPDDMRSWGIGFIDGHYISFPDPLESWNDPPVQLQRIRVQVDINDRSVSFFESFTNTQLCSQNHSDWPHLCDNMNLFPYFRTRDDIPLQIIPLAPRVTTQSQ